MAANCGFQCGAILAVSMSIVRRCLLRFSWISDQVVPCRLDSFKKNRASDLFLPSWVYQQTMWQPYFCIMPSIVLENNWGHSFLVSWYYKYDWTIARQHNRCQKKLALSLFPSKNEELVSGFKALKYNRSAFMFLSHMCIPAMLIWVRFH
jgi:hypothetical protein